jgi:hypothetical protein
VVDHHDLLLDTTLGLRFKYLSETVLDPNVWLAYNSNLRVTVAEREELYEFYIANYSENTMHYLYLHYSNKFLNKIAKLLNEIQQVVGYYELSLTPSLSSFAIVTPLNYINSDNNLNLSIFNFNNFFNNFFEELSYYSSLHLKLFVYSYLDIFKNIGLSLLN